MNWKQSYARMNALAILAELALTTSLAACSAPCPQGAVQDGSSCKHISPSRDAGNETGTTPSADTLASPSSNAGGAGGSAIRRAAGTRSVPAMELPCQGRAGEHVCDGPTMYYCGDSGTAAESETCTSEALCQLGATAGACAVCTPGTFRCDAEKLSECQPSGQYEVKQSCPSVALCKEAAGACSELVCTPNSKTCASDGTLRTCNAQGSTFDALSCGADLCDQADGRCNKCVPGSKRCEGNAVVTCSSDGQSTSTDTCAPKNDCWTASCSAGMCQNQPKAADTNNRCNGTGYCDGLGKCAACLSDSQCGADQICDASQTCQQKPCGNKTIDSGERCDPQNAAWVMDPQHSCNDQCELTGAVFRKCAKAGDSCWSGSSLFCSPVGICSMVCTSDFECSTSGGPQGSCRDYGTDPNKYCVVPCDCDLVESPGTPASCGCPSGLGCVGVGKKTDKANALKICGWANFDPDTANPGPW
jgi:hypothetical protein